MPNERTRLIQLQVTEAFEVRAKCWRERLRSLMRAKGLTQQAMAKAVNARFNTAGSASNLSQKEVSKWLRVGGEGGDNADPHFNATAFPRFEYMVQIAAVLGVDVGYLIGESDCKTFEMEAASKYVGIDEQSIESVKRIAISCDDELAYKYTQDGVFDDSSQRSLNALMTAPSFRKLIATLGEVERIRAHARDGEGARERLVAEFGEDLVDKAFDCVDKLVPEDEHIDSQDEDMKARALNAEVFKSAGVSDDEISDVFLIIGLIEDSIDEEHERVARNLDWEVAYKNEACRVFGNIIEEVYPE